MSLLVSAVCHATLPPPENVRVAAPFNSQISVEIVWEDPSDEEAGFEIEFSPDGIDGWAFVTRASANQTRSTLSGGGAGSTFFFRVRTLGTDDNDSVFTAGVPVTLPTTVLISADIFDGGQVGEEIFSPAPTTAQAPGETGELTFSALDLPEGFEVDAATGIISGTPTTTGIFRPLLRVENSTSTASTFVTLRVVSADTAPEVRAERVILSRSNQSQAFSADDLFVDQDAKDVVRVRTNVGVIDVLLYSEAAPITVTNFLRYVDAEAYSDVIFHRSVTSGLSIVQAGFLRPDPSGALGAYLSVPTFAPIVNEPGIPNRSGTIAPAKTANPDSATSQWFFNTIDNSGALDSPNNSGGFSVFGRAALPSIGVVDEIQGRPTGTFPLSVNGTETELQDWPTLTDPVGESPDPASELITIESAERIAATTAEVMAQGDLAVVSASTSGDEISFETLQSGVTSLMFEVADRDGNVENLPLEIVVVDFRIEGTSGGEGQAQVSFDHLMATTGFRYRVESSRDLIEWEDFWRTEDGFEVSTLTSQVDLGDSWRLTFSVPAPGGGEEPLFFRVVAETTSS